jgi:hypothetical protein
MHCGAMSQPPVDIKLATVIVSTKAGLLTDPGQPEPSPARQIPARRLRPSSPRRSTRRSQIDHRRTLDLSTWPTGSRVLVRRERAHPGAQLSFTDHDGHRFQPS